MKILNLFTAEKEVWSTLIFRIIRSVPIRLEFETRACKNDVMFNPRVP